MNLMINGIIWGILLLATIAMFLYRRWLEKHEDPYIHLHNDAHDASIVNTQTTMAKRLESVNKVKNILVIVLILYALAIVGMAVYSAWNNTTT